MFEDGAEVMGRYLGWESIGILSSPRATCVSATAWSASAVKTTILGPETRAEEELRVVKTGYPYQRTRDVSRTLPAFCD